MFHNEPTAVSLFSQKIKNKNSITSLLEEKERKQSY